MFGRVKKWLGIEGVKLELILPEEISAKSTLVKGNIRFTSMNPQTVTRIKVVMIEKYSRGRRKEKLTDEYVLGSIELAQTIEIPSNDPVEIDFTLPIEWLKSEVERFGEKNLIFGGLAKAAKFAQGAKSEFRIEAEAKVKGTVLNPFDRKVIVVKG